MPGSSLKRAVRYFWFGILMGSADVIPGISGGTVAFLLGIYEKLLLSIHSFSVKQTLRFLLPLGFGMGCSFLTLAHVIRYLLQHELYRSYLFSLFLGLMIASIIFCFKQLRTLKLVGLIAGILFGMVLSHLSLVLAEKDHYHVPIHPKKLGSFSEKIHIANFDRKNFVIKDIKKQDLQGMIAKGYLNKDGLLFDTNEQMWKSVKEVISNKGSSYIQGWLIFCGAAAILAMLLPGISGSYLLTVLGVYGIFIGAVVDGVRAVLNFSMDPASFSILFNLLLGALFGALFFSKLILWFLKEHKEQTLSLLIGFMVGSLPAIWPYWRYRYEFDPHRLIEGPQLIPDAPILPHLFSFEFAISISFLFMGWMLVFSMEWFGREKATVFVEK